MKDEYFKIHRVKYGRSVRWFNDYKEEINFSINSGFDFMQLWYAKAVGSGDLDFKYIFSEVLKDFHGSIIFEVVDEDEEIIKSKNVIREIIE